MIGRRVHPFDILARVLAERLRGCERSEELRAIVHSRGIDWERVVAMRAPSSCCPPLPRL